MSSEIKEINFVVGLPSSNNFVIRAISMPPKKQQNIISLLFIIEEKSTNKR